MDASSKEIGWRLGQNNESGGRYVVRFEARVLSSRHQAYAQVKRELWGVVSAMKNKKDYLIGAVVVVEVESNTWEMCTEPK